MRCLILEPTRELALQVEEAFHKYAQFTDLRVTIVYGGVGYGKQTEDLRRGMDILAATPGRLLDHLEQGNCSLDKIDILVLDEVDRMLDMGFLPDVKRIVQKCAKDRQTLFFTATLPAGDRAAGRLGAAQPREGRDRPQALRRRDDRALLLSRVGARRSSTCCSSSWSRPTSRASSSSAAPAWARTGSPPAWSRRATASASCTPTAASASASRRWTASSRGKIEVLVATDIAARGLDIAGVSHVINYDVPENAEDYVHRIGRTGRAQNTGDAFTLVTEDDVRDARSIERFIGAAVERKKIEGFPYVYSALFDAEVSDEAVPKVTNSRLHRGTRR